MKDCEGLLSEFSRIVLESRVSFLVLRLATCGIATQLLLSFLAVAALSRFVLLNHHQGRGVTLRICRMLVSAVFAVLWSMFQPQLQALRVSYAHGIYHTFYILYDCGHIKANMTLTTLPSTICATTDDHLNHLPWPYKILASSQASRIPCADPSTPCTLSPFRSTLLSMAPASNLCHALFQDHHQVVPWSTPAYRRDIY